MTMIKYVALIMCVRVRVCLRVRMRECIYVCVYVNVWKSAVVCLYNFA